ncbi:hypothetical protein ES702_05289 [subsurface metagenome]
MLINKNDPGAVIGALLLVMTLLFPIMGPLEVMGVSNSIDSEKIDLNITEVFSLDNTTSVRYERTFSLSEKQPISLIHVDCQAFEDTVKSVLVNISLNGVETSKVFEDSSNDYSSPYIFIEGSTLTLRIDPTTPLYILSNTISLEISVTTTSFFGSEVGSFLVQNAIFETFSPPTITASSENVSVPLSISKGTWYISPLSILKERTLRSEVYVNSSDKIRVRFDISLSPIDVPMSKTSFTITDGVSSFESTELSAEHSVIADLTQGNTLFLSFTFRPSSELAVNIIELNIDISVTGIPYIPNNNPSGAENGIEIANIPISSLELLRIVIIVVPLVIFYIRRNTGKPIKREVPTETLS